MSDENSTFSIRDTYVFSDLIYNFDGQYSDGEILWESEGFYPQSDPFDVSLGPLPDELPQDQPFLEVYTNAEEGIHSSFFITRSAFDGLKMIPVNHRGIRVDIRIYEPKQMKRHFFRYPIERILVFDRLHRQRSKPEKER